MANLTGKQPPRPGPPKMPGSGIIQSELMFSPFFIIKTARLFFLAINSKIFFIQD